MKFLTMTLSMAVVTMSALAAGRGSARHRSGAGGARRPGAAGHRTRRDRRRVAQHGRQPEGRRRLGAGVPGQSRSVFRRLRSRGSREQQADGARHRGADFLDDQAGHGRGAHEAVRARQVRARPIRSSSLRAGVRRISRCMPAWTQSGQPKYEAPKRKITMRDILRHTAGFTSGDGSTRPPSALSTGRSTRATSTTRWRISRTKLAPGAAGLSARHALAVLATPSTCRPISCRRFPACRSTSSSSCTSSGRSA